MKVLDIKDFKCVTCKMPASVDVNGQCEFCRPSPNKFIPQTRREKRQHEAAIVLAALAAGVVLVAVVVIVSHLTSIPRVR